MKILILVLLLSQNLFAESKIRLLDGKPEFAKWEVNGKHFWFDEEKDEYVNSQDVFIGTTVLVITQITKTEKENEVTSSNISFKNFSDFKDCIDNTGTLNKKKGIAK